MQLEVADAVAVKMDVELSNVSIRVTNSFCKKRGSGKSVCGAIYFELSQLDESAVLIC